MIWSCSYCGTIMKLWKTTCPNCRKKALSWLHVAVIGVIALPVITYVLKIF
jgi:uncharacterized OB-fold protein